MTTIYHNPRCGKSREGLAIMEQSGQEFQIIKYLDTPLSKEDIQKLLKKLQYKPIELIRQKETIWKEHFKGKELSDEQIIEAMVQYPKLIERPIVVVGNKAVVGRPPEKIKDLL
ncbi:arsenate reductase (glutaredoxin) [Flavobacteriaceae bacterium UJ101]|nr:arsenate reductase (glutaredoxin) [Flavobacteriaceae bacterium UJ101]